MGRRKGLGADSVIGRGGSQAGEGRADSGIGCGIGRGGEEDVLVVVVDVVVVMEEEEDVIVVVEMLYESGRSNVCSMNSVHVIYAFK